MPGQPRHASYQPRVSEVSAIRITLYVLPEEFDIVRNFREEAEYDEADADSCGINIRSVGEFHAAYMDARTHLGR